MYIVEIMFYIQLLYLLVMMSNRCNLYGCNNIINNKKYQNASHGTPVLVLIWFSIRENGDHKKSAIQFKLFSLTYLLRIPG